MGTMVLVSCHFLGAAYWDSAREQLEKAGHRTWAPELTGWGTRRTELGPEIGLATHIADVVRAIEADDLREVTLIGHSYGGMVIAGVSSAISARLRRLIFLDAPAPRHGESLFDHLPRELVRAYHEHAASGQGWRVDPPDLSFFGLDEVSIQRLTPISGPVPLRTCQDPLQAPGDPAWRLPRSYIWCREYPAFAETATRLRRDPGWSYRELATGHLPMVTHPVALATTLNAESESGVAAVDGGR